MRIGPGTAATFFISACIAAGVTRAIHIKKNNKTTYGRDKALKLEERLAQLDKRSTGIITK